MLCLMKKVVDVELSATSISRVITAMYVRVAVHQTLIPYDNYIIVLIEDA